MKVLETTNYKQFKQIPGNRAVDKTHTNELVRHMAEKGNLTPSFPVIVNENFEIIDGQHRVAALKKLKWPVYYVIQPELNIGIVRSINQAQRNWNWRDYATSFAELGNKNYDKFLNLADEYGEQFNIMKRVVGVDTKNFVRDFKNGDLIIEDTAPIIEKLERIADVRALTPQIERQGIYAFIELMKNPNYDHARMLHKLEKYGEHLQYFSRVRDMLRALEDIYNYSAKEVVRLF